MGIAEKDRFERYFASYFIAAYSMVTSNMILCQSSFEMIIHVFAAFFNCVIFGYIINKVGYILENIN